MHTTITIMKNNIKFLAIADRSLPRVQHIDSSTRCTKIWAKQKGETKKGRRRRDLTYLPGEEEKKGL
jgi:hypothetical protein